MPLHPTRARAVGREAVIGFRRNLAERVVDVLEEHDPALLRSLTEVGVVRRDWVEDGEGPMSTATPVQVVERLLERSVEQRPSLLATLGLSAIQVLSAPRDDEGAVETGGVSARVAVVFTDLEGFTRYCASAGDEAASALLVDHHRAVGPVVRSRGGRVVKRLGDGLLLSFPEPEAAVLACLELVETHPEPLRLRAGVHVGEVVVTRDDVIGHVVNVAARVAESAKGEQVVVTAEVREAIGDSLRGVTFGRLTRRAFKGIDDPVRVARVTSTP